MIKSIIFCGKGGQGILYASNIFVNVLFSNTNLYISSSDIHGLARRGGSVRSEIKYGTEVIYSPVVENADYIVDFDGNEYDNYLNLCTLETTIISAKKCNTLNNNCNFVNIDLSEIAFEKNISKKFQNMILLGFFIKFLNFEELNWRQFITSNDNYEAFIIGANS
jgi:hypothetical protein